MAIIWYCGNPMILEGDPSDLARFLRKRERERQSGFGAQDVSRALAGQLSRIKRKQQGGEDSQGFGAFNKTASQNPKSFGRERSAAFNSGSTGDESMGLSKRDKIQNAQRLLSDSKNARSQGDTVTDSMTSRRLGNLVVSTNGGNSQTLSRPTQVLSRPTQVWRGGGVSQGLGGGLSQGLGAPAVGRSDGEHHEGRARPTTFGAGLSNDSRKTMMGGQASRQTMMLNKNSMPSRDHHADAGIASKRASHIGGLFLTEACLDSSKDNQRSIPLSRPTRQLMNPMVSEDGSSTLLDSSGSPIGSRASKMATHAFDFSAGGNVSNQGQSRSVKKGAIMNGTTRDHRTDATGEGSVSETQNETQNITQDEGCATGTQNASQDEGSATEGSATDGQNEPGTAGDKAAEGIQKGKKQKRRLVTFMPCQKHKLSDRPLKKMSRVRLNTNAIPFGGTGALSGDQHPDKKSPRDVAHSWRPGDTDDPSAFAERLDSRSSLHLKLNWPPQDITETNSLPRMRLEDFVSGLGTSITNLDSPESLESLPRMRLEDFVNGLGTSISAGTLEVDTLLNGVIDEMPSSDDELPPLSSLFCSKSFVGSRPATVADGNISQLGDSLGHSQSEPMLSAPKTPVRMSRCYGDKPGSPVMKQWHEVQLPKVVDGDILRLWSAPSQPTLQQLRSPPKGSKKKMRLPAWNTQEIHKMRSFLQTPDSQKEPTFTDGIMNDDLLNKSQRLPTPPKRKLLRSENEE